ncbi:MAG: TauD/TfdA family dioxygenase [Alphaproteobacteria bacterium]|nr:TauD/TfdA family dioxygenase [Alphaproteobacteria bacterium]MCB9930257.1 TauD/TfdA family dioxygenase [Alphaproteobacteria bacterium]
MQVQPIAGSIGARVQGVDLSRDLSNSETADIYAAFLAHKVLVFDGPALSPEQQMRAARIFGEPDLYPFIKGLPEHPEIIEIVKTEKDRVNFGGGWHSDTAYLPEPAKGTLLMALETPEAGGDTLFANTVRAYESLSDGLKAALDGLKGVNDSNSLYSGGRAKAMAKLDGMAANNNAEAEVYVSEHPVVRTHPETGEKGLYLSKAHTKRFAGMTEAESQPLIGFLAEHITRPEFTCRVRWQPGTVTVWDNRVTQHCALNDYQGQRRRMRRITLKGDRPA